MVTSWGEYAQDEERPGFVALEEQGWRVLVRRGAEGWVSRVVRGEEQPVAVVQGGRARHAVVAGPGGGRVVVRRYLRGGLLRHLNRELYFRGHRAFEELRVTERARQAGVAVPEVVFAAERHRGLAYSALLGTRLIEEAAGADRWIAGDADPALAALRAAGDQIRRMHDAGIAHPDLNLRNLLVSGAGGSDGVGVHLIDFDRARVTAHPTSRSRRARDLLRLARSARKLGVPLEGERWRALGEGYGAGWPFSPG